VRRVLGVACVLAGLASHAALAADEPAAPLAAPVPSPPPAAAPAATPPATVTPATPPNAVTSSTVKAAARLALVGRTRERSIYIDKPTVRKISTDKFELWAEMHSVNGERIKFLMQLNCADRSYLIKSEVVYGSDGQLVENETYPSPALQYVVPDSTSEMIHEAICRETP
jgi:hypothetical protein